MLSFEPGVSYVMSRGCVNFARLYTLHQAGAFIVTRAKSPMDARQMYSAVTDRIRRVVCDRHLMLDGYYSAKSSVARDRPSDLLGTRRRPREGSPPVLEPMPEQQPANWEHEMSS